MSALVAGISAFALVCCSFAAVAFGAWLLADIRRNRGVDSHDYRRPR